MIRSFRLRLALSSALLSGLALALFSASALWLIDRVELDHLDRTIRSDAEREAGRPAQPGDWARVTRDFANGLGRRDASELLLLVQDERGATVHRSGNWPAGLDDAALPWPEVPGADPRPATASTGTTADGRAWRIGLANGRYARVAVGVDLSAPEDHTRGVRAAFLVALPVTLLLIGVGAWFLSSRALRPIAKLTAAARRVADEGLDQHIPLAGEDREFRRLIEVFNDMLTGLNVAHGKLERMALHDALTGLANRRKFQLRYDIELARQQRSRDDLVLLVLDIDHFKAVNDAHGHVVGDVCLRAVAQALARHARASDTVARFGGEEFLVLLAGTSLAEGARVAEKLRRAVESTHIPVEGLAQPLRVSVSIGVAARTGTSDLSLEGLIERADAGVYRAKQRGRNQVCLGD
jgi:diguanylate cyclase (GGDEF)-like protein